MRTGLPQTAEDTCTALGDQMKVAQRTKKALKDTPRESYQLYRTWR